jgi:hypothetical protein
MATLSLYGAVLLSMPCLPLYPAPSHTDPEKLHVLESVDSVRLSMAASGLLLLNIGSPIIKRSHDGDYLAKHTENDHP